MTTSRRTFLGLAGGTSLAAALAACGSSGPGTSNGGSGGGGSAKTSATYWTLSGHPQEDVRTAAVKAFNQANPDTQIKVQLFQNDPYKTKIKTAIGSGNAPTLIWGWGGGGLASYVQAGQVDDLTDFFAQNSAVKDKIFPSSFAAATVDGKIYAMPIETVQPIVMYYNKKLFEQVKVQPPTTWDELMALVPKFNAQGIAPFALAGGSRWTNMMWLEFLFDRIGGPELFNAAQAGEKDAWSNPDAIKALTMVQQLVNAKGFIKGYSSIVTDADADQALLYRGRAAMMLHGSWSYGTQAAKGGSFVKDGNLGFGSFPAVEGGKGDPSNTYGNPGQYVSISSKATDAQKAVAKKFLTTGTDTMAEAKGWIGTGNVPLIKGTETLMAASPAADFLKFVYDVSVNAKTFSQSWDQALPPAAAETLLDNIVKLFQGSVNPQKFAANMNAATNK
jgi:raffinose/stachyose/melibiose transport system substrate-binding protein